MAWIESHQNIKEHKKTYQLMATLECSKRDAIAIVHMIWWWCLDNALDGRIEVPPIALKAATEWEGDANNLVDGLLNSGWLERHTEGGILVHDWHHYCGALVEKRLERKQYREKKAGAKRHPKKSRSASKSRPTVSVPVPVSVPKRTPYTPKIEIPEDLLESKAEIEDWLQYKRERGQSYKSKTGLKRLWDSFRSIPKEKRRDAIDHSMARNWSGFFQKQEYGNGHHQKEPQQKLRHLSEV